MKLLTILVGFSEESLNSKGEITLIVYAEGVNVQTKFQVMEAPSTYNIIQGMSRIHELHRIPLTLHKMF